MCHVLYQADRRRYLIKYSLFINKKGI